ncbi:MtrAB system accessory lipoprotein LpqB [Corynebacterium sp.]|uniref:MtrAB system accessory lipoprotein LpqB n=1 Tax=Corynebacterium sp. TaxID=1720 RepID=UPI0026DC48D4|nr:MtrAB system accessory lipoprotein LpqB [Corynebacterium sp.]MDO5032106.1 MtrAB system accessory lipoprotein LpqB [Corynebacterium sp.]
MTCSPQQQHAPAPAPPARTHALRRVLVVVSASALATVAGCSTLPRDTSPQVVATFEPHEHVDDAVVEPRQDSAPDLLLRDFYSAAAIPSADYAAARTFLSPDIANSWDPTDKVLVVDSIDLVTSSKDDETLEYSVRGNIIGQLAKGGAYTPDNSRLEATIRLRQFDGQWRIVDLPNGAVIERTELRNRYRPQPLYFFDSTQRALVSDRRWLYSGKNEMAEELVTLLTQGPSEVIRPAATSLLPDAATFLGRNNGVYEFTGLAGMSQDERLKFAAQLVWTLNNAEMDSTVRATADGGPLVDGMEEMTIDDFGEFNPEKSSRSVSQLYALNDGAIWKIAANGNEALGGDAGHAQDIQSADISGDDAVAIVRKRSEEESQLYVGELGRGLRESVKGKTLARPTFELGGQAAWTVVDGHRVVRVTRSTATGELASAEVDTSALDKVRGEISVIRLSRTGARLAMIIDGDVYIGVVSRASSGDKRIVNVHRVGPELTGSALSLDWQDDGSLLVGTSASKSPVWRIEQDGSSATTLPAGNITAPVVAVAASPSTLYVTDAHAILQLPAQGEENYYWREVDGLQGQRSAPIVAH